MEAGVRWRFFLWIMNHLNRIRLSLSGESILRVPNWLIKYLNEKQTASREGENKVSWLIFSLTRFAPETASRSAHVYPDLPRKCIRGKHFPWHVHDIITHCADEEGEGNNSLVSRYSAGAHGISEQLRLDSFLHPAAAFLLLNQAESSWWQQHRICVCVCEGDDDEEDGGIRLVQLLSFHVLKSRLAQSSDFSSIPLIPRAHCSRFLY